MENIYDRGPDPDPFFFPRSGFVLNKKIMVPDLICPKRLDTDLDLDPVNNNGLSYFFFLENPQSRWNRFPSGWMDGCCVRLKN